MLRLPLLALALAVLVAASAQLAHADGAAPLVTSITIAPSDGGAARTLDLAALTDRFDVHGVAYTLRAADGTTTTATVAEGISLTALLAAAGLDADAFTYLEIPGADGASAIVLRDDLGGTEEGPPVVWGDAQGVHFLRPSAGERDTNGADLVTLADGAIAIGLKTGDPVVPRIAVSTLRARPRERVDFSASLVGAASLRPGLEYQWYFDDGTGNVRGASVSHRFPPGGPYLVLLNVVRGDGTSIGSPATVRVHVVRLHERRSDDAHGSDESQGDGDGSGGSGTGDGTGAGSGTDGSDAATSTYVAPLSPPAASPTPAPAPAPRHASPPPRQPRGDLVSGTLVASASAASTPVGGGHAASAVAHRAASDGPLHLPIGIWVGAGLVLLLALGWVLESRHTLPFWQP
ncbi:MAG TPA: PKD domain-containing protein [Conexibacter sp.]|nr:PKD domain-containing protein [Conexibacter sp.]